MKVTYSVVLVLFLLTSILSAQTYEVPEVLYYKFNEAGSDSTQNYANPGAGSAYASVLGALTMGGTGQFGAGLLNAGGTSGSNFVNTNWVTSLTGNWTISFWITDVPTGSTTLWYLFGDNTAQSFRCFFNGVAGTNNIMLRGTGMTDVVVTGVAPGPTVVHFVYNGTSGDIKAYKNGALVATVAQSPLTFNGTAAFKVAGYSTLNALPAGSTFDEFRLYNRALEEVEISWTWNQTLPFIVPVELTSFSASVTGSDATLIWSTATETNNNGFSVQRKSGDSEFHEVSFVPGFGTTTEPKSYSYTDEKLQPGIYTYRLKQMDFDGTFEYSSEVEVEVLAPAEYSLHQNYPNPFNPSTTISFSLASDAMVTLKIFNILGQEEKVLLNQTVAAGNHEFNFNADGLNSGIYFYTLDAAGVDGSNFSETRKMILIK